MLERIRARAEAAREARVFPGCSVGLLRRGEAPQYVNVGALSYETSARAATETTRYDMASVTKSIPTASLALCLAAEKKLDIDAEVALYIPELKNHFGARVRDLLRYRVAGARLSELKAYPPENMLAYLFERGFDGPPGEERYANLPALFLGIVIERASHATLETLSRRYFFDPLKMADTAFFAGAPISRAAPTEAGTWRGDVVGVTHDESAYVLAKAGRVSGHAGLFSTTRDMCVFLRALLDSQEAWARIVAAGAESGLGWQKEAPYFMGSHARGATFGKTGFTGTSVLVDRELGVALCISANRTFPQRPPSQDAINAFRADIADIVLGQLH